MDKITEEVLTNLIRRIEILENKFESKFVHSNKKYDSNASEKQLKYIQQLGGETWDKMSKKEAAIEIERLLSKKEKPINDAKYLPKVHEIIAENDPHKKLTKEEIDEIGEESLL